MKSRACLGSVAIALAILIATLPVAFADSISLSFDKNGNLISGDGLHRTYNSLNQLIEVRNGSSSDGVLLQQYTYDPVEERVLIKRSYNLSSNWTETVIYVNENYLRLKNSSGTYEFLYVKHNGQRVAELKPDNTKIFFHPDHIQSNILTTNEAGESIENTSTSPYGVILEGGNSSRYSGYESMEFDDTTGQYDFNFRGYKSEWGKFTQPDSLLPNQFDPQQLNRYAFEHNNPLRYTDPTGHIAPVVIEGIKLGMARLAVWWMSNPRRPAQTAYRAYETLERGGWFYSTTAKVNQGTYVPPQGRYGENYNNDFPFNPNDIVIEDYGLLSNDAQESSKLQMVDTTETNPEKPANVYEFDWEKWLEEERSAQKLKDDKIDDDGTPKNMPKEEQTKQQKPRGGKGAAIRSGKICVPGDYWVCTVDENGNIVCENVGNNC